MNLLTKIQNKKGVTLIEVMIVIAIIAIGTAVVLVSLSSQRKEAKLDAASRELVSNLREMQNNALAGKQMVVGGVAKNTCGFGLASYGVKTVSYITYFIVAPATGCSTLNHHGKTAVDPTIGTYSLAQYGVNITPSPSLNNKGNANLFFEAPFGKEYNQNAVGQDVKFTLQFGNESRFRYVCVKTTGEIIESKTGC